MVCLAVRSLKSTATKVNLVDPEAVEGYSASARFSPSRKECLTDQSPKFTPAVARLKAFYSLSGQNVHHGSCQGGQLGAFE